MYPILHRTIVLQLFNMQNISVQARVYAGICIYARARLCVCVYVGKWSKFHV